MSTLQTTDHQILTITGMTCGSCARSVERALSRVPGVQRANVDLTSGRAIIEGSASLAALVSGVQAAGYSASPVQGGSEQGGSDERRRSGCCR